MWDMGRRLLVLPCAPGISVCYSSLLETGIKYSCLQNWHVAQDLEEYEASWAPRSAPRPQPGIWRLTFIEFTFQINIIWSALITHYIFHVNSYIKFIHQKINTLSTNKKRYYFTCAVESWIIFFKWIIHHFWTWIRTAKIEKNNAKMYSSSPSICISFTSHLKKKLEIYMISFYSPQTSPHEDNMSNLMFQVLPWIEVCKDWALNENT